MMSPLVLAAASAAPAGEGWLIDTELVDPAFSQTVAGGTIQTSFPAPPPPPETPEWLRVILNALRDFLEWAAPAFMPLLVIVVAAVALILLYYFLPSFRHWIDALRGKESADDEVEGIAEAGAARALLAEAEALAAAGRFAEAVHLLLYRSIEDIDGRRPGLVRPAMTARELAGAHDLPSAARGAFARIARAVEISLFGGRAIDAAAWASCRDAYAELTVPKNWARG